MSQPLTAGVGKRIARYRKLNGWSAQRLADNSDGQLSRATIASIESGRRLNLRLDQFLAISLALRVPPLALLIDMEQPFEAAELQFPGAAPKPLGERAPNIAIARWLNGSGADPATAAAKHVATISALIDDYLAARDAFEAGQAVQRLHPGRLAEDQARLLETMRVATQNLKQQGISTPP